MPAEVESPPEWRAGRREHAEMGLKPWKDL